MDFHIVRIEDIIDKSKGFCHNRCLMKTDSELTQNKEYMEARMRIVASHMGIAEHSGEGISFTGFQGDTPLVMGFSPRQEAVILSCDNENHIIHISLLKLEKMDLMENRHIFKFTDSEQMGSVFDQLHDKVEDWAEGKIDKIVL